MKSGIWQIHWLALVGIYLFAKNYENICNGSRVMPMFAYICTDQGLVDGRTDNSQVDYTAHYES